MRPMRVIDLADERSESAFRTLCLSVLCLARSPSVAMVGQALSHGG